MENQKKKEFSPFLAFHRMNTARYCKSFAQVLFFVQWMWERYRQALMEKGKKSDIM